MPDPVPVYVIHRNEPDRCVDTVTLMVSQDTPVEVVVVDNGSAPGHLERVRDAAPPGVRLIANGENLGFGPGVNVAWRDALSRWDAAGRPWGGVVVVCPHDAQPAPDCIRRVVSAMAERPRAGLACAEFGVDEIPVIDDYFGGMSVPAPRGAGWQPVGYPHGTLLVARLACLDDIGLFDERYFAYTEEADLAVRATSRGWEVGMVWGALVANPHLSTPAALGEYLMLRNSLLFVRTHFGRYKAGNRAVVAVLDTAYRWLRPAARNPWFSAPARIRALVDFARGRFGPPPPNWGA